MSWLRDMPCRPATADDNVEDGKPDHVTASGIKVLRLADLHGHLLAPSHP